MMTKSSVLLVLGALFASAAAAQDARTVLQAAADAIGARTVRSIEYTGTGWVAAVGQSFTPDEDWPRFEVVNYSRTIDYQNRSSREEYVRRQGDNPQRGGGGTPLQGEQPQRFLTNGNYSWNLNGAEPAPEPAASEVRQLDIWLSPHGFIKAALEADDVTASELTLEGKKRTIVSFTVLDKYRVNGTLNEENLVERTQTWIANPVLGDTVFDHRYSEYKDFGGVKFPAVLHSHQGDPRLNAGHNWKEVRVTAARANVDAPRLAVPDNVRSATVPAVRVESNELARGVWRIAGGSHHSVAVEFRDFVAVVEAPLDEARSLAVIAETKRLIPGKPIRYVVNTHHHFDHSGGLRTYVAQSATVVTHEGNREFYDDVVFHPGARTVQPDLLSSLLPWFAGNRVPAFETVSTKYVISDGQRTLDLYSVQGLAHSGSSLVAYLPTEKILINADLYSPPAPGAQPPVANASLRSLHQNIQRLGLDVERHVGIHGQVASHADFLRIVGGS
jgi:glyoxylase-like metal-dependent hydrolase (beta-lactamase superfamily II)